MTSNSTKKFINLPEKCVDDALEGFVQSHNNVMLVENHRVVVRQDVANLSKAGKVTLLGGGGAGHEPAFAGFVGVGMLTAAISGAVFASPPPSSILAALRAISSPAGMLMIVLNYTGDRLNFGIAAERSKAEGMRVDMLIVGDDCALTSGDKSAGRRGLCGMILAQKMAGALAEMGKSLEEVKATVTAAVKNMGTIGLSLSPCSVPGHGPTFTIGEDEMELGLGIHGEAGVRRMKLLPAAETVSVMLDHMLDQKSATCFPLKSGDAVALAVNNLGGTSVLELNIVTMEALRYLEKKGAAVEQVYAGSLITSLEMAGFSLTLLLLDDVRRSCLNQVTEAPAWPHVFWNVPRNNNLPKLREPQSIAAAQTAEQSNAKLTPDGRDALQRAVRSACEALIAHHDHLNALDEGCGDGDCGSTITRGAKGVLEGLHNDSLQLSEPGKFFMQLGHIAEETMGGASGGLYSLFFSAVAWVLCRDLSTSAWVQALKNGIEIMSRYGGAEIGDRTMLDALNAAYVTLQSLLDTGCQDHKLLFEKAAEAAEAMAERTAEMAAHAGRASYVHRDLTRKPDAGATAAAIWLRAAASGFK